jgi:hypothetical protein
MRSVTWNGQEIKADRLLELYWYPPRSPLLDSHCMVTPKEDGLSKFHVYIASSKTFELSCNGGILHLVDGYREYMISADVLTSYWEKDKDNVLCAHYEFAGEGTVTINPEGVISDAVTKKEKNGDR